MPFRSRLAARSAPPTSSGFRDFLLLAFGLALCAACDGLRHASSGSVSLNGAWATDGVSRVHRCRAEFDLEIALMLDSRRLAAPIHLEADDLDDRHPAWTDEHGIHLGPGARGCEAFYLAHELVHWHAARGMPGLPVILEEGLADEIGCRLVPHMRVRIERLHLDAWTHQSPAPGLLSLDAEGLLADENESREGPARALGYWISSTLGVRGLRSLGRKLELHDWEARAVGRARDVHAILTESAVAGRSAGRARRLLTLLMGDPIP